MSYIKFIKPRTDYPKDFQTCTKLTTVQAQR